VSDTPEDAWLIALGSAVSDGADVDWEKAERQASDESKKDILRQLRGLATIVQAHRSDELNPSDSAPAQTSTPSRHWRHIVLFEVIGSGAFGTVHRGWDPTLDRDVAVKLLRSDNGAVVSPLEEARHLARVRHTNVVTVYGADREGDETGIWMEYIEGHTLARIVSDSGALSAREATGVGVDLCRALAALHGAGLLHRDIKAQNVMREVGGRIVLMDFSGARTIRPDSRDPVTSGTPLYMAPEVLRDGTATIASDVYSLGVLLFFLLSGSLPIEGHTVAELRRAHAEGRQRRLRDLRPDVPDAIVQVIERAIARDGSERHHTAGELEHALITASGSHPTIVRTGSTDTVALPTVPSRSRGWRWVGVLALFAAAAVIAVGIWFRPADAAPHPLVTHFTIGPPFTSGSWPRISPDGRFVVFGAIVEGRDRFWVRPLDAINGWALMNTTANESPFWSPDGSRLCFFADGKLKRIPVESGYAQPEVLADAPTPHGGEWNGQSIVFGRDGGIFRVALDQNASVNQLTKIDPSLGEFQHAWPAFLPDGRRFLFVIRSKNAERNGIYLGSIDGDAPRFLMPAVSRVKYIDGHLLFVRQGILVAQRFNLNTLTLEGQPISLADRLKFHPSSDAAFDVSSNGVLVYGQTPGESITRLMLFDGRGRELEPLTAPGSYRHPRVSPDGRRVVAEKVNAQDGNVDVWLYDLDRRALTRLTSTAAPDSRPTWSADGTRIAFSSRRGSVYDVFVKSVDTTETEHTLITGPGDKLVEHWSADGKYLSLTMLRSGLWIYPLNPSEKPWMVRASQRIENWQSEFSPDGKWLAYMSNESGNPEVYVEPVPATGARWQVSTHGGAQPHWRNQGHELLYVGTDGLLMTMPVTPAGWQESAPMPLFHISIPDLIGNGDYSVSPNGDRIVVNTFISDPVVPPIDVVVNWPALLKR
jgi:eukaryotic-like serine/threonine-protein kinase